MAYFLFKCWHEVLYFANRQDIVPVNSTVDIEFLPITAENAHFVKELRGEIYEGQFLDQIKMGDVGLYATVLGKPVGYGWAKRCGSDDYFFKIGQGAGYYCRFFVHPDMRGKRIYPALLTELISRTPDVKRLYIARERGNEASERGLMKLGFSRVGEFGFVRGFKHTFNKKKLK